MRADGSDGGGGWWQLLTPQVLLIGGGVLLLVLLVLAWLAWRVLRRVRRSGAVQRGALAVRAKTSPPGPGRDLAQLRRDLSVSLHATEQMATATVEQQRITGFEADSLLGTLRSTAAQVDADLAMLEHEPDPARQHIAVLTLRPQVHSLMAAAGRTRQGLNDAGSVDRQVALQLINDQVRDQTAALDAYLLAYRELGGGHVDER